MAQAGEWVGVEGGGSRARWPSPRRRSSTRKQHRQGEVHLGGEGRKVWVGHHVRAVPSSSRQGPIRGKQRWVSCKQGRMNCPTVAGRGDYAGPGQTTPAVRRWALSGPGSRGGLLLLAGRVRRPAGPHRFTT